MVTRNKLKSCGINKENIDKLIDFINEEIISNYGNTVITNKKKTNHITINYLKQKNIIIPDSKCISVRSILNSLYNDLMEIYTQKDWLKLIESKNSKKNLGSVNSKINQNPNIKLINNDKNNNSKSNDMKNYNELKLEIENIKQSLNEHEERLNEYEFKVNENKKSIDNDENDEDNNLKELDENLLSAKNEDEAMKALSDFEKNINFEININLNGKVMNKFDKKSIMNYFSKDWTPDNYKFKVKELIKKLKENKKINNKNDDYNEDGNIINHYHYYSNYQPD